MLLACQDTYRDICMQRRDPTRLNLCSLQSLTHLELVGCDLSTSAWLGLEAVQPTLVSLACHNTLEELWHLLSPSTRPAAADHGECPDSFPVHTSDAPLHSLLCMARPEEAVQPTIVSLSCHESLEGLWRLP